ncbi:MAG: DNA-processing protein DprA [Roseiflexaceae bacterium]|nr:DNA-processing protein DprA [Roseiflexaceae bacterium]
MENTHYYLGFNRVNGIGPARLDRLIERCGSIEAAWHASPAELAAAGLEPKLIEALIETRRTLDLDREMERAQRAGITLIDRENPAYPAPLRHIPSPPPLIYVRGALSDADAWSVAVVGTRQPTSYGREATRRLTTGLVEAGVTIVSGLALGIDGIAHAAALDAGGRTLAVLPCGADMVYPERHAALAQRIASSGALISEFPLGARPIPQLFPVRNRLISGLARGVLVVEAGMKSGALITVDYALEQGRDVFAVPGPIFSPRSEGTNQLIKHGAGLVTCAGDILEALNMGVAASQQEVRAALPDDPVEAAVLALVGYEPLHIDDLQRRTSLPIYEVSAALAVLELKGFVRQCAPMCYVLAH